MTEEIKCPVQRKTCLRSKRWFECKFQRSTHVIFSNGSPGWRCNAYSKTGIYS